MREFKESTKLDLSEQDEYIFSRYVENDIHYLRILSHLVADPQKLHERVVGHEKQAETGDQDVVPLDSEVVFVEREAVLTGPPILDHVHAEIVYGRIQFGRAMGKEFAPCSASSGVPSGNSTRWAGQNHFLPARAG